jgi:hypothetical protein
MIIFSACCVIVLVVISPEPALAWGPVTHVALGMQVLATVITPEHPLQATLLKLPEIFLYGGLAPDIVQGRRLQSRLRRHSHNWNTGFGLLGSARSPEQQALAWGYLAQLAADVVAHNYFLPARFIGRFESGIASHLYTEARYDTFQAHEYQELLVKLLRVDFGVLNQTLKHAIDSPLFSFSAHQRIFEGVCDGSANSTAWFVGWAVRTRTRWGTLDSSVTRPALPLAGFLGMLKARRRAGSIRWEKR